MGLDQVIGEVRRDGEAKASATVQAARSEADGILGAARKQAQAYEASRLEQAARDAAALGAQAASRAESEARKAVLSAEAELRADLRRRVLEHFAALPTKARDGHLKSLLATAQTVIPGGTVWGAAQDASALKASKAYKHAGNLDIAGGIVVESEDGKTRLDLSYETLVDGLWRDVLRAEADLFKAGA